MNNQFVSVMMPCYNDEKFVKQAVESLLNQTRTPDEIVIVDDCSTDDSWNIIQRLAKDNPLIKVFRNEENLGTVKTRNKLLHLVSQNADVVAILDSDDVSRPKRIESQLNFLENHPEMSGCGTWSNIINMEGEVVSENLNYKKNDLPSPKFVLQKNPYVQSSMMIRKKVFEQVGGYDEKFERGQDHEMWLRMISKELKLGIVPKVLVDYRVHPNQGKVSRKKLTYTSYARVRLKYLFKKDFFSFRAMILIGVYYLASFLPATLISKIYLLSRKS